MFSLFSFLSIFPGGSADPICPYVRTPMLVVTYTTAPHCDQHPSIESSQPRKQCRCTERRTTMMTIGCDKWNWLLHACPTAHSDVGVLCDWSLLTGVAQWCIGDDNRLSTPQRSTLYVSLIPLLPNTVLTILTFLPKGRGRQFDPRPTQKTITFSGCKALLERALNSAGARTYNAPRFLRFLRFFLDF